MTAGDDKRREPNAEPPAPRHPEHAPEPDEDRAPGAGVGKPPSDREIGENQGGGIPGAIGGGQSGQGGG